MSYNPPAATDAARIDGFPVPTPGAAEDEKVLTFDNDISAFKFTTAGSTSVTMGGDVTGSSNSCSVVKIEGVSIPAPIAGDDQKFIQYNNAGPAFQYTALTSVAVGGDLSGTTGSATVIKIRNKPIPSPGAGDDLKVIQYNDSTGQFQYATMTGGGSSLTVQEQDGSPAVSNVNTIKVSNGTLTDNGGGVVSVTTGGGSSGNSTSTTAFGSEPGSPASGDLDFYNNSFYVARYSGAAWIPWGPLYPFTAPINGDFAWINQGSATVTTTFGGIHLHDPFTAAFANSARIRKKAAPSTPYTITVFFLHGMLSKGFHRVGVGFRESSSGKLVTFGYLGQDSVDITMGIVQWASATVASTNVQTVLSPIHGWLRLGDNGTNRTYEYSPDGENWTSFYSETRTTFITADEVFFFVQAQNVTTPNIDCSMTLLSWKQA